MEGSVLVSPDSDETQGGVRPSSQEFSSYWLPGTNPNPPDKVQQAGPGSTSCCLDHSSPVFP